MRTPWPVLALLCATTAHAGGQTLGPLGPPVLGAVAAGVSTLAIVRADRDDLLWAAWDEPAGQDHDVRLALLRRRGRSAVPVWSGRYAGGYAPALDSNLGWRFNDRPVVMLRFQLGAAAVQAEFLGLARGGGVRALGSLEGALIEPILARTTPDYATVLRIWDTADLKGPPRCTGWDAAPGKLVPRPCPP